MRGRVESPADMMEKAAAKQRRDEDEGLVIFGIGLSYWVQSKQRPSVTADTHSAERMEEKSRQPGRGRGGGGVKSVREWKGEG